MIISDLGYLETISSAVSIVGGSGTGGGGNGGTTYRNIRQRNKALVLQKGLVNQANVQQANVVGGSNTQEASNSITVELTLGR